VWAGGSQTYPRCSGGWWRAWRHDDRLGVPPPAVADDIDPDRLSFTTALRAVRRFITATGGVLSHAIHHAFTEILEDQQERRDRVGPRVVKRSQSPYPSKKHAAQPTSTAVDYTIGIVQNGTLMTCDNAQLPGIGLKVPRSFRSCRRPGATERHGNRSESARPDVPRSGAARPCGSAADRTATERGHLLRWSRAWLCRVVLGLEDFSNHEAGDLDEGHCGDGTRGRRVVTPTKDGARTP
jgi:hypothetical protein